MGFSIGMEPLPAAQASGFLLGPPTESNSLEFRNKQNHWGTSERWFHDLDVEISERCFRWLVGDFFFKHISKPSVYWDFHLLADYWFDFWFLRKFSISTAVKPRGFHPETAPCLWRLIQDGTGRDFACLPWNKVTAGHSNPVSLKLIASRYT